MAENYICDGDFMKVNKDRIAERIDEIGSIGIQENGGIHRFSFTAEDYEAKQKVIEWAKGLGLEIRKDSVGNIFLKRPGKSDDKVILMGSHIDTVPNGGKFDGLAGIVSYMEVIEVLEEHNIETNDSIEFVIFVNEEGSRFPGGLMGSLALAGKLPEDFPYVTKDKEGVVLADEMIKYGCRPDEISDSKILKEKIKCFIELHIEQGRVLEDKDLPIGIVTGISGPYQGMIKIHGETGHAGATPMDIRRDPMVGAGKIILEIDKIARKFGENARGTIGYIKAYPGGHNIIPYRVDMSFDYRDLDIENRKKAADKIKESVSNICGDMGLDHEIVITQDVSSVMVDEKLFSTLRITAEELNIPFGILPSGAAHDAMIMGQLCPMSMIFIKSKGGLSHCPEEYSSSEDLALGTELLFHFILKMAL